jgi:predicted RNase H-like nuclease
VVDHDGRLRDATAAHSDEQILAWLRPFTAGACLVAFDAPLIVANPSGRRPCEAQLSAVFGKYDAGTHPSNTRRPEFADGGRALRLSKRLDLDTDPSSTHARRAIEVYPHPATIALFGLDRTIKYKHKPGRSLHLLRAELLRLLGHIEALETADPPLWVRPSAAWRSDRLAVEAATRKSALKQVEDVVDAVLCAYIARFAGARPADTTVYGDAGTGFIVTPSLARTQNG